MILQKHRPRNVGDFNCAENTKAAANRGFSK